MIKDILQKQTLQLVVVVVALVASILLISVAATHSVHAIDVVQDSCKAAGSNAVCSAGSDNLGKMIGNIINILLYLLGAIAVIMIIIGGIKYATANGDPSQVKSAKDTIMYAVIGLVVALMAGGIVNFVVNRF